MMPGLFITSVGTGIGKTLVTAIMCHQLTRSGLSVRALKPVVSGFAADDPSSDPALILRSLGDVPSPEAIAAIAPWRFALPLSPHLAARREGHSLSLDKITAFCREQERQDGTFLLIEGAGGVMAPIDQQHTVLDLIVGLGYPVILVTGSYLGAISHTLTALYALRGHGARTAGVVVSESEPSAGLVDTAGSLRQFVGDPGSVYALPRLAGSDEEKWSAAPALTGLCNGTFV
jgi:dethiobiotin synthetase